MKRNPRRIGMILTIGYGLSLAGYILLFYGHVAGLDWGRGPPPPPPPPIPALVISPPQGATYLDPMS